MKVYLAGGMKTNWQDRVQEIRYIDTYDPRDHQQKLPSAYTTWDLLAVSHCDVLFGYLEADNPSGIGLALEIGYAKALGKTIIFVCEKEDRYFDIAKAAADVVFDNLNEGIEYLKYLALILD